MPNKTNTSEMSNLKDVTSKLGAIAETLKNLVTKNEDPEPTTENASVSLEGEGSLYFEGELSEGTAVFADEAMEEPATGEVILADGRKVTITDGKVETIEEKEEEAEDVENKELEAVNARLDEMEAVNTKTAETLETIAKTMENFAGVLTDLKNIVPGDSEPKPKVKVPTDYKDMTNKQKMDFNRTNY